MSRNPEAEKLFSELSRVKALLSMGWTKEAYARDAEHTVCEPDAPQAVCFCVLGACTKVSVEMGHNPIYHFLEEIRRAGYGDVPTYNDDPDRTKEDILGLCDKVIERAKTTYE